LEWWSAAQQQMVNIQNRPAPMLNAAASQVVARKLVLRVALTPYDFATDLIAPTTMEDWTVAITDATMIVTVDRPEMIKVMQDPTREQKPKRPRKSSTTQVTNAII